MRAFHTSLTSKFALAILLGTAALSPAYAHNEDAPHPPAHEAPAPMMENHVEHRIKTLHDELKITPDQEESWQNVANVMRDNEVTMAKEIEKRKAAMETTTAIDDIKSYQSIAQAHADGLAKFVDVFEPFYNDLSDAQKKTADAFFKAYQHPHHDHMIKPMNGAMKHKSPPVPPSNTTAPQK